MRAVSQPVLCLVLAVFLFPACTSSDKNACNSSADCLGGNVCTEGACVPVQAGSSSSSSGGSTSQPASSFSPSSAAAGSSGSGQVSSQGGSSNAPSSTGGSSSVMNVASSSVLSSSAFSTNASSSSGGVGSSSVSTASSLAPASSASPSSSVGSSSGSSGAPWTTFHQVFRGVESESVDGVALRPGGGFMAVGFTNSFQQANDPGFGDGFLVAAQPNGQLAWDRVLGSPDSDQLTAVVWAGSSFLVTGYTGAGPELDTLVAWVGDDGALQASHVFPVAGSQFGSALAMRPDNTSYLLASFHQGGVWLMERDASTPFTTNALWSKVYDVPGMNERVASVVANPDGTLLLSGTQSDPNQSLPNIQTWVMKLSAVGDQLWRTLIVGGNQLTDYEYETTAVQLADGRVVVNRNRNDCGQVVVLTAQGALEAQRTLCNTGLAFATYKAGTLLPEPDGGFSLLGSGILCTLAPGTCIGTVDDSVVGITLSRFDASLQPLWHRFYGNLGTQVFAGTALRTTGGYLLTSGRDTADAHFISVTTDGAGNACGPHHGVPAPLAAGNLVSFAQSELATVTAGPNVQPAQGPGYRNSALATLNQCP